MSLEKYRVQAGDQWFDVSIEAQDGRYLVTLGDKTWQADMQEFAGTNLVSLILDRRSLKFLVDKDGDRYTVLRNLELHEVRVKPAWATAKGAGASGAAGGEVTIESPLVGLVLQMRAEEGQEVQKGDVLCVIEAMKMQNEVKAPRAGTVRAIRVSQGQKVAQKQPLIVLA